MYPSGIQIELQKLGSGLLQKLCRFGSMGQIGQLIAIQTDIAGTEIKSGNRHRNFQIQHQSIGFCINKYIKF